MPTVVPFDNVFIARTGAFLPGAPVDNAAIDRHIAPLNRMSARIKRRILDENGIRTRHYATDEHGATLWSAARMGAEAVRDCLDGETADGIGLLATGTSGGDLVLPGFANQLQAELGWRALATASHHGVCASGMQALANAARAIERGEHARALVVTSELPSRLFKRSRFAARDYDADFDAHFLRWMLSDGAGAWLLQDRPRAEGPSLKLHWVHSVSHSGDYPLCMQMGLPHPDGRGDAAGRERSWLDYPSFAEAEADGALHLRQDIRLLPHLFDIGTHEYVALARAGAVDPGRVDHFLCHYSSERFRGVVADCLDRAQLTIPEERWYSNLARRGNTGAASIFLMLHDFLREREVKPGERILLFVPESGRFTVSFALLEAQKPPLPKGETTQANRHHPEAIPARREPSSPACGGGWEGATGADPPSLLAPPPHDPAGIDAQTQPELARLLRELAAIWHDYRARAWHAPIVRRVLAGEFGREDYLRWMAQWIPQVREGSRWMREASANIQPPFEALRDTIEAHAGDEQYDYDILFQDYRKAGGSIADIDALRRNPGGEALNAYLHARAALPNAIGLLGAIYIIEGTGQRIIPALLPLIRRRLWGLGAVFRFLHYHGENDVAHLRRWLDAVEGVLVNAADARAAADDIVRTAHRTAELYLMQLEEVTQAP